VAAAAGFVETAIDAATDEWLARLWREGDLSWKLDAHQRSVYDEYRAWEARVVAELSKPANDNADSYKERKKRGLMRCFVLDIGRRWGKTFLVALIRIEDCLRAAKRNITYATAFEKDIVEIIQPMIEDIIADAPDDVRPKWIAARGHWLFRNGSTLKLVGIDKNPKGLRGKASDGFNVTEAAYVKNLGRTIGNVVYPQFQRKPWALLILESNAPEDPDHDFDRVFVEDAKRRNAWVFRTIDDNTSISDEEKQEFIDATATATSPEDAQREYYGKRYRDPKRYVIPNFDRAIHVGTVRRPNYAKCFVAGDPGTADMFGLVWGYWHFEKAMLVIERDWAKANAPDLEVAEIIRRNERELWGTQHREPARLRHERDLDAPELEILNVQRTSGGLAWKTPFTAFTWWNGQQFVPNPACRYMGEDGLRTMVNLRAEHEIAFTGADTAAPEAQSNSLRTAFSRGQILISPECVELIAHLESARWDERRTKWERHPRYGHYDLVAALMYLWSNIDRVSDPNPPLHWDVASQSVGINPGVEKYHYDHSFAGAMATHLEGERAEWR
jgi:hypothetical protein